MSNSPLLRVVVAAFLAKSLASLPVAAAADADAATLLVQTCTQCHDLSPITSKRDGIPGWLETVEEMVLRGAQLDSTETKLVASYLGTKFGPGTKPMSTSVGAVEPEPLPEGEGDMLVRAYCGMCHDTDRITSVSSQVRSWDGYVSSMLLRGGFTISKAEVETMVQYLNKYFPPLTAMSHLGH